MRSTLALLQSTPAANGASPPLPPLTWAQIAMVALPIAVIAIIAFLVIRAGVGGSTLSKHRRSWLDYGNLYVVALGIGAVVIAFLVTLLFLERFTDPAQALGFLTALFGAVAGLVGTFFGVKNSADAREGAENVALDGTDPASTAPAITIAPRMAPADGAAPIAAGGNHTVTATVVSVDGSAASRVPVTFKVIAGPDAGTTEIVVTDDRGQAAYTLHNNGTAGTDTIEATSLGGSSTATVLFG